MKALGSSEYHEQTHEQTAILDNFGHIYLAYVVGLKLISQFVSEDGCFVCCTYVKITSSTSGAAVFYYE